MTAATTRRLWPIGLLLGGEAVMLILVTRLDGALPPLTGLSVTAATLCLVIGLWPLLLRPSTTTQLSALLGIVLAGFVLIPTRPSLVGQPPAGMLLHLLPAFMLYRLVHGVLLATVSFHVAVHFPPEVALSACPRPPRWSVRLSYMGSLLVVVAFMTIPSMWLRGFGFALLLLWVLLLIGRAIGRLACLSHRSQPEQPQITQQARILLVSALLAAIPTLGLNVSEVLIGHPLARADLVALFLLFFPIGAAYTILRHDLLTLDSALRRTLAYTALSAFALLLYFTTALFFTIVIVRRWPHLANVMVALSVLTTAFAFAPLQSRVQELVDRWLYPERRRLQQAVTAAHTTLGNVLEPQAVIALLTQQLPAQLDAQWATLTLAPAPATPGQQPTPPVWNQPLVVGERVLGRYWLGPRRTLPTYELDEQALLRQLLDSAALVLAYTDTIAALHQINQELEQRVTTRTAQMVTQQRALAVYAERQQLARNLHDSITQSLFSLNLSLRAMRKLAQRDPQAALAQLPQQEEVAQQALNEMRALLGQLRSTEPTAQDDTAVDLVLRLQALCTEQQTQHGLQVTLQTPATCFCRVALTTELLFIVREALHNVSKHSGVKEALCTLTTANTTLQIVISDQGRGFDLTKTLGDTPNQGTIEEAAVAPVGHFGLRGIQERAAALGGQVTIQSAPGQGTTLTVQALMQTA